MNIVTFDGPGYDVITNNLKVLGLSDLKQHSCFFFFFSHSICPSRIHRATLFIGGLLRTQADANYRLGGENWGVMYWVIISLEARSDADQFHSHFLGQYMSPGQA